METARFLQRTVLSGKSFGFCGIPRKIKQFGSDSKKSNWKNPTRPKIKPLIFAPKKDPSNFSNEALCAGQFGFFRWIWTVGRQMAQSNSARCKFIWGFWGYTFNFRPKEEFWLVYPWGVCTRGVSKYWGFQEKIQIVKSNTKQSKLLNPTLFSANPFGVWGEKPFEGFGGYPFGSSVRKPLGGKLQLHAGSKKSLFFLIFWGFQKWSFQDSVSLRLSMARGPDRPGGSQAHGLRRPPGPRFWVYVFGFLSFLGVNVFGFLSFLGLTRCRQ